MDNRYEFEPEELDHPKPNQGKFKIIFRMITLIVVFVLGYRVATISFNRKYGHVDLNTIESLNQIETIIEKNYYQDYDKKKLYEYAQNGMVYGLGDPYSYFLSKDSAKEFDESVSGNYVGIGVTLSPNEAGEIEVVAPFEGSPAQEAGILAGDVIAKVNDKPLMYENIDEAVSMMKGKKGEKVTLELKRAGQEPLTVTVIKRQIEVDSVVAKKLDEDTLYLRISRFDLTTADDFKALIDQNSVSEKTKLILDLRDNPGGVVIAATKIADLFIEEGVILTEKYRNREDITEKATPGALNINYPIVVLVNENSASSSEILTGALKDHEKAILIGEKTYGKGLLNQKFRINNESSMVVSIAQYTTPSGANIHGVGIEPHINVPLDLKKAVSSLTMEEDLQLARALEYLKNR